jgi:hypothetical protein
MTDKEKEIRNNGQFGMGTIPSISFDTIATAKFMAAEFYGAGTYSRWGGPLFSGALGSIAVIDAAAHGEKAQVAAEIAGVLGGIAGGFVGAEVGAAFGAQVGALIGGVGAVPGAILGGLVGAVAYGFRAGDVSKDVTPRIISLVLSIDLAQKKNFTPEELTEIANKVMFMSYRDGAFPYSMFDKCFEWSTTILSGDGDYLQIRSINVGGMVFSFDGLRAGGRSSLVSRRVVRLFHNITTEWVILSWQENGDTRELTCTPGHHFLDEFGNFPTIDDLLELNGGGEATIVLADGSLQRVSARRVVYSAETADLYERASKLEAPVVGGLALAPRLVEGWATYNFEVEDLHTYVAGGDDISPTLH